MDLFERNRVNVITVEIGYNEFQGPVSFSRRDRLLVVNAKREIQTILF